MVRSKEMEVVDTRAPSSSFCSSHRDACNICNVTIFNPQIAQFGIDALLNAQVITRLAALIDLESKWGINLRIKLLLTNSSSSKSSLTLLMNEHHIQDETLLCSRFVFRKGLTPLIWDDWILQAIRPVCTNIEPFLWFFLSGAIEVFRITL